MPSRPARRPLPLRRLTILSVLFGIAALAGLGIDAGLTGDLALPGTARTLWRLLLLAMTLAVPIGLLVPWIGNTRLRNLVTWPSLILMGLFSTTTILALLRELVLLALPWLHLAAPPARDSARAVVALALLATATGFYNARRLPPLKRLAFRSARIDGDLEGLRVLQLSDIHIGPTIGAGHIRRIVAACNRAAPDIVVITGDVVDGPPARLAHAVAELGRLQARHGVFMVPGNHDYYSGIHDWLPVFRSHGIDVLINGHRPLAIGTGTLYVAGVTDHSAHRFVAAHRSSAEQALAGIPEDAPVLMLAHQPVQGLHMPSARIMLQLSGHTHGGQFFPWRLAVPLQQPITAGLSTRLGHPVYVSRGTGYWGPPKRLFSPAEITLISLHGHDGS